MKLKSLAAFLLSAALTLTAVQISSFAEEPSKALTAEYTVPTLPDTIRLSDIDPKSSGGPYLSTDDDYSHYLYRINRRPVKYSNYFQLVELTAEEKNQLEKAVSDILSGIEQSWTDLQKVIYLHDYITSTKCYDLTYSKYSAYDILVTGTAVCQGYAEAFWYLTYKLGIECKIVASDTLNHAWNIVKINGKWYQLDLTWDDPIQDVPGRSVHTYFLLSDSQFRSINDGHHDADDFVLQYENSASAYGYCTDAIFDSGWFWNGSRTPTYIVNNEFYNIVDGYLTRSTLDNKRTPLLEMANKWYVVGNTSSYYAGCYSGLAYDGTNFYYNNYSTLYSCDSNGQNINAVYVMTQEEQAQYRLYSLIYSNGYITMGYSDMPARNNQATKTIRVVDFLSKVECLAHSVSVDSQISVSFYIFIPQNIVSDNSAYMNFTINGKKYSYPVSDAPVSNINGKSAYAFSVPIAAAEMTDIVSGYLSYQGERSSEFAYSVRTYADYILSNSEEYPELIPIIKSMLSYGAAAQNYFKHNTDTLANSGISDDFKQLPNDKLASYKPHIADKDSTLNFSGQSLSLHDTVSARLYFSGRTLTQDDLIDVSGIDPNSVSVTDGYVLIKGISAGEFDKQFSITVGNITISNYSAYSYIAGALESSEETLVKICEALYSYNESVKEYIAA